MVEHTDNQKRRGNAENKTAFYYIRYRQANVSRISAITSCLEIVIASKSPVGRFFQKVFSKILYDRRRRRQMDKTDYLTPLAHTRAGVKRASLPMFAILLPFACWLPKIFQRKISMQDFLLLWRFPFVPMERHSC